MVTYCCVKGCKNHAADGNESGFFLIPKVWERYPKMKILSQERRKRWIKALNIEPNDLKFARVCSRHFISGKSAHLSDYSDPDWVPTLNLGNDIEAISLPRKRRIHRQKRRQPKLTKESELNDIEVLSVSEEEDEIKSEQNLDEDFLEDHLDDGNSDDFDAFIKENEKPPAPAPKGVHCCVPNCKNVRTKYSVLKFFRFPSVTQNINGTLYRSERLAAWINAIKRLDITHLNAQYKIICSEHFKTGSPANANDKSHVDWIPSQKLPTALTKAVQKGTNASKKIYKLDNSDPLDPLAEDEIHMEVDSETEILSNTEIQKMKKELQQLTVENSLLRKNLVEKDIIIEEQNTKIEKLLVTHKLELHEKDAQIQLLETTNLKIALSRDGFRNDDKKVNYFTGLPSFAVLEIIFNFVQEDLHASLLRRINKFDAFILVLLKLRLDLPLAYIGYRFGIAGNTAATIFHTNLKMLSEKIGPFIRWPDKTAARENTSVYFKRVLGSKFTAMLDFIEDPGPNVSQEYKAQKKYVKNKYLLAISPAGAITFVSKGYDSSLSLKEIAESCGVLDYTDDGDIILSSHGLVTHQVYSYNGSKVLVESNPEQNDLLDTLLLNPNQSQNTKDSVDADNSRIYIQRTISNLTNKFFILRNKQRVNIDKSYKNNDGERYFDYVVRVCCALANVSPAIITLDTSKS